MSRIPWRAVVLALLGLVGLWVLAGVLQSRPPNADLARVTGQALDMAREAQRDAVSSDRSAAVLRVLALVAGVSAPLVVAYLIHRLHARSEVPPGEVLETLEKAKLLDWKPDRPKLQDKANVMLPGKDDTRAKGPSSTG
jgi:hypothetical protein